MRVNLGERSYNIFIEKDFIKLPEALKEELGNYSKILLVTDTNVDGYYSQVIMDSLEIANKFVFEAGEHSKNLDTVNLIYDCCLLNKLDRNSVILAVGGGVTGDMAGFVAATFMRGIKFVQIPTSLLAQADSSVGGKVGVDYRKTKNIIGAFYQPSLVYINTSTLKTLPTREFTAGMAEVIKHGIICDSDFFEYVEQNLSSLTNLDSDVLGHVAQMNCLIKSRIVEKDETEQGIRAVLNLGHTIGHAIESVMNFSLLHGECVSIGINLACAIAVEKNLLCHRQHERITNLLQSIGLPVSIKVSKESVYNEMLKDKKIRNGEMNFILPVKIGEVIQSKNVIQQDIMNVLDYMMVSAKG